MVLEAKMLFATGSEFGNGVVTNAKKIYAHPKFHVISPQLEFSKKNKEEMPLCAHAFEETCI